ncbi:MAG: glycerophosphodiester phosphodiesterase [Actinomycetota bacterium]
MSATSLVLAPGLYAVSGWRHEPQPVAPFFDLGDRAEVPMVVAHQGGELLRPSNTMEAFRHAVELGVDVLDTDLHRTADGALVLIHDETVDRTSDGTGAVRDLTLDELRTFDFGSAFTPVGGPVDDERGPHPWRDTRLGIVTVDELFAEFGDRVRYGIEIKQTVPDAADELCAAILRAGLERRVLVSSFTQPNMDAFRSACPDVATSATGGEVRTFYLLHRANLSGLVRPAYDALQIPERAAGFELLTPGLVDDARGWGLAVVPWTIDDPDTMDQLLDLGVDGINTNRPDLLADRLAARSG